MKFLPLHRNNGRQLPDNRTNHLSPGAGRSLPLTVLDARLDGEHTALHSNGGDMAWPMLSMAYAYYDLCISMYFIDVSSTHSQAGGK
jgi:hypothetical protein